MGRPDSRHAQLTGTQLARVTEQLYRIRLEAEDLTRQMHQPLAEFGGAHAAAGAVEQLDLVERFELADLRGHRGLADMQLLGGAGEAPRRRDGVKRPQLCQTHDMAFGVIPGEL